MFKKGLRLAWMVNLTFFLIYMVYL